MLVKRRGNVKGNGILKVAESRVFSARLSYIKMCDCSKKHLILLICFIIVTQLAVPLLGMGLLSKERV